MKTVLRVNSADYARYSAEFAEARKEAEMVIVLDDTVENGTFNLTGNLVDMMGEPSEPQKEKKRAKVRCAGRRGSTSSRKRNRASRWG